MRTKIVAVSGYFVWFHVGHLYLLREAKKYGKLVVIVNNDNQQIKKYNRIIVPLEERLRIIASVRYVDKVVSSIDKDRTVCETLKWLKPDYFINGGDRHNKEIPEEEICDKWNIKLIDGVGDKIQSASNLIKKLN